MHRTLKPVLAAGVIMLGGLGLSHSVGASPAPQALAPTLTPTHQFIVAAARIFDSRDLGTYGFVGPVKEGFAITACATTRPIAAITVKIGVTNPQAAGYLTAYPGNGLRDGTSVVDFKAGDTVSGVTTITTDVNGCIRVEAPFSHTADIIVDQQGYWLP